MMGGRTASEREREREGEGEREKKEAMMRGMNELYIMP